MKNLENLYIDQNIEQNENIEFAKNIANSSSLRYIFDIESREKEINTIAEILLRKYKKNCILIGENGVGKNTIVFLFAQKIAYKNVPLSLLNKKIYLVDFLEIISSAESKNEIADIFFEVLSVLESKKNAIIYFKNIHNFIGLENDDLKDGLYNTTESSPNDFWSIIKYILDKSQHSIIATTLTTIYKEIEESHSWLKYNFEALEVIEPNFLKTYRMLSKHKSIVEAFHNITISEGALYKILNLSKKYDLNSKFPKKALTLLDSCAAKITSFMTWQKNFTPVESYIFNILKTISTMKFETLRFNNFETLFNLCELEFFYTKILKNITKKKYNSSKIFQNFLDFIDVKSSSQMFTYTLNILTNNNEKYNDNLDIILSKKKNNSLLIFFDKITNKFLPLKEKSFYNLSIYDQILMLSYNWLYKNIFSKTLLLVNSKIKKIKNLSRRILNFVTLYYYRNKKDIQYNPFNILNLFKRFKYFILKFIKLNEQKIFSKKKSSLSQKKLDKSLIRFLNIFKASTLSTVFDKIKNKTFNNKKNISSYFSLEKKFENYKQQANNLFFEKISLSNINNQLTLELVDEFVFDILNISKPQEVQNMSMAQKLLNLERELKEKVAGQEEAVSAVSNAMRRAKLGLRSFDRPIASFFFCGPTGVGKTEVAKALSICMYGSEEQLIRFDMSEYMEKHAMSRLVGAPAGYVGYEDGGQLTNAIAKNPHAIVLFDEIEKAHSDISYILLQVLDDGRLTDSKKNIVRFENTIIIMTSNAAAEDIEKSINDFNKQKEKLLLQIAQQKNKFRHIENDNYETAFKETKNTYFSYFSFLKKYNFFSYKADTSKKLNFVLDQSRLKQLNSFEANFKSILKEDENLIEANKFNQLEDTLNKELQSSVYQALSSSFAPEFLNRIDNIIIFKPLNENDLKVIAKLFLNKLIKQYKSQQIGLVLDFNVLNKLVENCYEPKYGARPLRRGITKYIEDLIIEKIISLNLCAKDGLNFVIGLNKANIIAVKEVNIKKKGQQVSFF